MPKACELKKGAAVEVNEQPYIVKSVEAKSPSSRGAQTLYKIQFKHAQTGQKLSVSFSGDDMLKPADFSRREVQYLYKEDNTCIFMDKENFDQHTLQTDSIEDQLYFLSEDLEGVYGLILEDVLVGIELPQSVTATITDTAPAIKGATSSGRTKPATIATGFEVQVPEYLSPGETIKINTDSGKFMSRA